MAARPRTPQEMTTRSPAGSHARAVGTVLAVLCSTQPVLAHAGPGDAGRAEQLFRDGKQRLAQKDYEHACPLLAQSVALDPASGSLLALALCHEREGKLASAFGEYSQVVARSRAENRPDRQRAAQEKATGLEAMLSTLTISTPEELSDLEVRVNGAIVDAAQLGKPMPVDGGSLDIAVAAPGKKTWTTTVAVAPSGDAKKVVVPVLEDTLTHRDEAPARALGAHSPTQPTRFRHATEATGSSATRWAGIGAITAGGIAATVGGLLVLHGIGKYKDARDGCVGDVCTIDARRDRLYARDAGNAATIAFIVAGGLVASGLVLYVAGGQSSTSEQTPSAVAGSAWIVRGGAGASVRGTF